MGKLRVVLPFICAVLVAAISILGCTSSSQAPSVATSVTGPDAQYTFSAIPNNVPSISFYSWWIDDVPEKELEVDLLQFAAFAGRFKSVSYPHEYKIKVKA